MQCSRSCVSLASMCSQRTGSKTSSSSLRRLYLCTIRLIINENTCKSVCEDFSILFAVLAMQY